MKKKYYLGGPMTGLPDFNYPRFDEAAEILRDMGLEILSAHEVDHNESRDDLGSRAYHEYLKGDLKVMLQCDAVIFLEGWHRSKGANLEFMVAQLCGMEIWEVCSTHICTDFLHKVV